MPFKKVRFTSKENGNTSGLILDEDKLNKMTISEISKLFPYSESMKMEKIQLSPSFPDWEQCFKHDFNII
jgi:hypothetical protein